ncbi:hypothetical protein [uncultured Brevundimonas sp.]|uniref:anti-sigma factor family protein n=1 Tax=uncultured Brevundimonas sp. TaxID=213418 RepID=UPI0030EE9BDC|tara:strand:- start:3678 stop:4406 length:729 start_codon:yes stop_codon:yes gene_type:complete
MTVDDLTLMAFVDGELTAAEHERVTTALALDPALQARAEALRGARCVAREAFPIVVDPLDTALAAHIRSSKTGTATRRFTPAHLFAPRLRRPALWAGLAVAGFAAGIGVGWLAPGPAPDGLVLQPGAQIADGALTRVLDTRMAGDGVDASGRRVNLTFRTVDGEWCRTFAADADGVAGLACRKNGHWQARVITPWVAPDTALRTASAETPAAILAEVDALISGQTLDAAAEADLLAAGWSEP